MAVFLSRECSDLSLPLQLKNSKLPCITKWIKQLKYRASRTEYQSRCPGYMAKMNAHSS